MTLPVAIVDFGRGNLFSVSRAVEAVGGTPQLTDDPEVVACAERLILPGVGAFGDAMKRLDENALSEAIRAFAARGGPLLGICLGMQLILEKSFEFGEHEGLKLLPGKVERIRQDPERKLPRVPSVGWCPLRKADAEWQGTPLSDVEEGEYCYFVHSYAAVVTRQEDVLASYDLQDQEIAAVIHRDNVTGCQFHPEKSGLVGARILSAWMES